MSKKPKSNPPVLYESRHEGACKRCGSYVTASDASADPRDVAHMLDMAAFEITKTSIAVSDMLSDLAWSVKTGDRDLSGFKERWLK